MQRKIEKNDQECFSQPEMTAASKYCWEYHYPEKLKLESRIRASTRASLEMTESLEAIRKDAQRLNQSFSILNPENNDKDAITIRRMNDEFDRKFINLLNKLKSDGVIEGGLIDQKIGMVSSIKENISNSLRQIDAAVRDRSP
jgi:hypothetical protein